jgi:hypothetical protein
VIEFGTHRDIERPRILVSSVAEELLRVNESTHGERTASELQDRVTELIEQQTAISEVLRAIASSPSKEHSWPDWDAGRALTYEPERSLTGCLSGP